LKDSTYKATMPSMTSIWVSKNAVVSHQRSQRHNCTTGGWLRG